MLSALATRVRSRVPRLYAPAPRPPGPPRRFPGDFVRQLATDKLELFRRMGEHGDVTEIVIGPARVMLLLNPEDIRQVLVAQQGSFTKGRALDRTRMLLGNGLLTSEGQFHLRQRRMIQPAFHRERLRIYGATMATYAERQRDEWTDGEVRDVHEDMMRLTLAIAGKTLFDVDVEADARLIADAMELSLRMFNYSVLPLGGLLELAPIPWVRELHRLRRSFDALIARLVAERRAEGGDRGDLLSELVAAADDDQVRMTDRQLRDELVTLLMAGHETTANALTWTWHLLGGHPEVEAELHAELDAVLGGRTPTVDDLPRLTYTRNVLAESMRLYPPAWILERRAKEDVEVGGYTIPAGTIVLMSQFLVHRDPRWWEEPERFDPARWSVPAPSRPKMAYFPFGAGTRMCIGEHFAWMEGTLVLAALASRWRMRPVDPRPPRLEALVTLRPKDGLRMRLESRR